MVTNGERNSRECEGKPKSSEDVYETTIKAPEFLDPGVRLSSNYWKCADRGTFNSQEQHIFLFKEKNPMKIKTLLTHSRLLITVAVFAIAHSTSFAGDIGGDRLNIGVGHSLSGTDSSIAGGLTNKVNANYATVSGGTNNRVANDYSFICGGDKHPNSLSQTGR